MSDKNFLVIPNFKTLQFNISAEIQNEDIKRDETDF
jgi:hypothetical protein